VLNRTPGTELPAEALKPKSSWRDVLPIHPAAELFPLMSEAELPELGEDIKKNGLTAPIIFWAQEGKDWEGMAGAHLLDGRNRLDAMELAGIKLVNGGRFNLDALNQHLDVVFGNRPDPYAYVISANIQRRHLTAELRRELIANVLKAKPEQSDRVIAKQLNDDHKKVGRVRKKLESTGSLPQLEKTRGADGKERPARMVDPLASDLKRLLKEARKPAVQETILSPADIARADRAEARCTARWKKFAAQEERKEAHRRVTAAVADGQCGDACLMPTEDAIELGTLCIVWRSVTMAAAAGKKAEVKKELKRLIRAAQKALKSKVLNK
jgi:hypothetical protein